jgi:hypothetical protein
VTVAGEAAGKERRHDAGADCLIQQHREGGITLTDPEPQYAIEQNGPPGDRGRGDDTAWTHDPRSFAKTLHPGGRGDQVAERGRSPLRRPTHTWVSRALARLRRSESIYPRHTVRELPVVPNAAGGRGR